MADVNQELINHIHTINTLRTSPSKNICEGVSSALFNKLTSLFDGEKFIISNDRTLQRLQQLSGETHPGDTRLGIDRCALLVRLDTLFTEKNTLLTHANTALSRLPTGSNPAELTKQIRELGEEISQIDAARRQIELLHTQYQALLTQANNFNCSSTLTASSSEYQAGGMNFGSIALSSFVRTGTPTYALCDKTGKALSLTGGNYTYTVGGTTYTIGGIAGTVRDPLDLSRVTVTPQPSTLPLKLELAVSGSFSAMVGGESIDVVHIKPLTLEITETAVHPLDHTQMNTAYGELNRATPPYRNSLTTLVTQEYQDHIADWEEQIIKKILSEGGRESKINEIWNNPMKKQILLQRIRNYLEGAFPGGHPYNVFRSCSAFQTYVTDEAVIKKEQRKNEKTYKDYLSLNYASLFAESTSRQLESILASSPGHRDVFVQIFSTFLSEEEQNKFDHNAVFSDLRTLFGRDDFQDVSMRTCTAGHLRNKRSADYSHMICNGQTASFQGEKFDVTTGTEQQHFTYGASLSCNRRKSGRPDFRATFTINGQEYPTFIGASLSQILRNVLNQPRDKEGTPLPYKLRVRMVISLIKCFFSLSPWHTEGKKDILERNVDPGTTGFERLRCESSPEGGLKLIGVHVDPADAHVSNTVLFDEAAFKFMQDEATLAGNVDILIRQITGMLNDKTQNFLDATTPGVFLKSDYGRPYKRAGIFKRAFRWLFRYRKDYQVAWTTEVPVKPPIHIAYDTSENKVFTVTVQTEPPQEFCVKDIGEILGNPLFHGCQMEMVEQITRSYCTYMRDLDPRLDDHTIVIPDGNSDRIFVVQGDEMYSVDLRVFPDALDEAQRGIPNGAILCDSSEVSEFYSNPFLGGKLMKYYKKHVHYARKQEHKNIPFYKPYRNAA